MELRISKRESQDNLVHEILSDGIPVEWKTDGEFVIFSKRISPRSEKHFEVLYREQLSGKKLHRSLRFELSVAGRRILSEFSDDYLSRSRFLSTAGAKLKSMLTKSD